MTRALVVLRKGRHAHRWTPCRRCRVLCRESEMFEVARPGASRGVMWCEPCRNLLEVDRV